MFFGRENELKRLNILKEKSTSSLVAVTGRRRIGKSRLLEEFGKTFDRCFVFSGLPPLKEKDPQAQRDNFTLQMSEYFDWANFQRNSWSEIFSLLSKEVSSGSVLLVFDEISWMANRDKLFLGQLKNAWDLEYKKNPNLVLALCGSVSSWVESNILNSTGFVGRVSETIKLKELDLKSCSMFWQESKERVSAYEKLKMLSVVGGVPRYLEEMVPSSTSEGNIMRIFFNSSGFLFDEFEKLFSDLFTNKQKDYRNILTAVSQSSALRKELVKKLGLSEGGSLSLRIDELVSLGFLSKDYTWNINTSKKSSFSKYRLSDNYSRFYLKYLFPFKEQIREGVFPDRGLSYLPGYETVMGLQFENLILNNKTLIFEKLGLDARDVTWAAPYFQKKNKLREGCQIDLLIQTRFKNLFICEVKNSRNDIPLNVAKEVDKKMKKLQVKRDFSLRPVLISAGSVSEELRQKRYFDKIIEGKDLLN